MKFFNRIYKLKKDEKVGVIIIANTIYIGPYKY